MALSITVMAGDPSVVRLAVAGEVDLGGVDDFRAAVAEAVAGRPATVVVDLDAVTFLDSTGIGGLVGGRHLADAQGVSYRVVNAHDRVRWVLDVSGVWAYLAGEDTGASS